MSSKYDYSPVQAYGSSISRCPRAIVGVLNSDYQKPSYGLGNARTVYPISAFITHLVWLEGTSIKVDVTALTVSLYSIMRHRYSRFLLLSILQALGVKAIMVKGNVEGGEDQGPRYDAGVVRHALTKILA